MKLNDNEEKTPESQISHPQVIKLAEDSVFKDVGHSIQYTNKEARNKLWGMGTVCKTTTRKFKLLI